MRQKPDVSKIMAHFNYGYMNVLFQKDTVRVSFLRDRLPVFG